MASGSENPLSDYNPPISANPNTWDVVKIAGQQCPGYCELSGFERKWKWDRKKGKGAQGATSTYTGVEPVEGEIIFYLWSGLHFQEWESFRSLFKYDPTKQPSLTGTQAVDIYHASLADIGIKSVVCESISPIRHVGSNLFECRVKLLEYIPAPKASAVATPSGAKSGIITGVNASTPAPTDPLQLKIQQLYQEFQKV